MTEPIRYRHRTTLSVATLREHGRSGALVGYTDGRPSQAFGSIDAARRALAAGGFERDATVPPRKVPLRVATDLALGAPPEGTSAPSADAVEMRRLRELADASQETVAALLGVDLRTLQRIEAGTAPVRKAYLVTLGGAVAMGTLRKREQAPPPRRGRA